MLIQRNAQARERRLHEELMWIKTIEDAELFCRRLDATPNWWGTIRRCNRATEARSRLVKGSPCRNSPDQIRTAIVDQHQIVCGCHDSGSFDPTTKRLAHLDAPLSCKIPSIPRKGRL